MGKGRSHSRKGHTQRKSSQLHVPSSTANAKKNKSRSITPFEDGSRKPEETIVFLDTPGSREMEQTIRREPLLKDELPEMHPLLRDIVNEVMLGIPSRHDMNERLKSSGVTADEIFAAIRHGIDRIDPNFEGTPRGRERK